MVVAITKYENNIKQSLKTGMELINGFRDLKSPVIIKPNICTLKDKTGFAVTDVKVVEALITLILEEDKNLSIKIVESDSMSKTAAEAFEKFGYRKLEEKMHQAGFSVSLVDLSQSPTIKIDFEGDYFKNPEFPDILVESHFFISLAVAKTHYLTTLTGTLKNLFGLLPRKDQAHYHPHINDVIVDLNRFIQPALCILDARVTLDGWNGPIAQRLNQFIIGKTTVATDAILGRITGHKPEEIQHLAKAASYNLGSLSPKIVGEKISY